MVVCVIAFLTSSFAASVSAINIEPRDNGIDVSNASTPGHHHIYPVGTRLDWENKFYMALDQHRIFDGTRPAPNSGLNYAATPVQGNYWQSDSRTDYNLDAFPSQQTGTVIAALPNGGNLGNGWQRRLSPTLEAGIQMYYLHQLNYTTPGQIDVGGFL